MILQRGYFLNCPLTDLTLYTRWLEMTKTVTKNSVEVAITSQMRGFLDEYGDSDADILFLEGEIHSDTKPVNKFASRSLLRDRLTFNCWYRVL